MIKKLFRIAMTLLGVAVGYGVFLLAGFFVELEGIMGRTLSFPHAGTWIEINIGVSISTSDISRSPRGNVD